MLGDDPQQEESQRIFRALIGRPCLSISFIPNSFRTGTYITLYRNFAENVGLMFHTPEEYFLQEEPRPFTRSMDPSEYLPNVTAAEGVYPCR